jgi:antirestriction protein ArdC
MSKISDLYQSVTDAIIAELEAGAPPWVKPWTAGKTGGLMPANAATGRA